MRGYLLAGVLDAISVAALPVHWGEEFEIELTNVFSGTSVVRKLA
jgi:hypothetical protein